MHEPVLEQGQVVGACATPLPSFLLSPPFNAPVLQCLWCACHSAAPAVPAGIEYVVPFSAASLLVTLVACGLYYGLLTGQHPSLHVRAVAGPALLTGVLWSLGNLCSIWAVQHLGLSVGFPLVQCQLIVSTAWAVLYYREVPAGSRSLWMFVGSTLVVVAGMMLLAAYGS